MVSLSDDVPGRDILFGRVLGELPRVEDPEFDMRANRLLLLAVQNMRAELEAFVARHGAHRVAVVLGASNTGIDEAQRHVDRWLDEGAKPPEMFFSQIELGTPADFLRRLRRTRLAREAPAPASAAPPGREAGSAAPASARPEAGQAHAPASSSQGRPAPLSDGPFLPDVPCVRVRTWTHERGNPRKRARPHVCGDGFTF